MQNFQSNPNDFKTQKLKQKIKKYNQKPKTF